MHNDFHKNMRQVIKPSNKNLEFSYVLSRRNSIQVMLRSRLVILVIRECINN